jgi:hypothetical protein
MCLEKWQRKRNDALVVVIVDVEQPVEDDVVFEFDSVVVAENNDDSNKWVDYYLGI